MIEPGFHSSHKNRKNHKHHKKDNFQIFDVYDPYDFLVYFFHCIIMIVRIIILKMKIMFVFDQLYDISSLSFFFRYKLMITLKNYPSQVQGDTLPFWFHGSFCSFVLIYWLREFLCHQLLIDFNCYVNQR